MSKYNVIRDTVIRDTEIQRKRAGFPALPVSRITYHVSRWLIVLSLGLFLPKAAQAFCGFYVAQADSKLFNHSSKVVLVRSGEKTYITMASDYEGDAKEFALVIPVPTVITKEQIHLCKPEILDHLDKYSGPRLVEYFDEDPCHIVLKESSVQLGGGFNMAKMKFRKKADALGVTIEAEYTVGEYDILILSAKQSDGLVTWLNQEHYKIPDGAGPVLESYIKQNTKFFVAKVNLKEKSRLGVVNLRPITMAFSSPKFMLPIRLGTVNASGPQDLIIYAITEKGRVETTNYQTVKIPSDFDVPLYIKDSFGDFYKAVFDTAFKKEDGKALFTEYAWNMGWCDPCAGQPLPADELRELGAFWVGGGPGPGPGPVPRPPWGGGGVNAFLTRIHVRYDREHFPDDLMFQETMDSTNFQGRYIMRHPWIPQTKDVCPEGQKYLDGLPEKNRAVAEGVAQYTGWKEEDIADKMAAAGQPVKAGQKPTSSWPNVLP